MLTIFFLLSPLRNPPVVSLADDVCPLSRNTLIVGPARRHVRCMSHAFCVAMEGGELLSQVALCGHHYAAYCKDNGVNTKFGG
jgi:hypothetical protein